MKKYNIIGLMSGTSMDGIDGTFLISDGKIFKRTNINATINYNKETKHLLLDAQKNPKKFIKDEKKISYLKRLITLDHFTVIKKIIRMTKCNMDLIGFHGQTIYHSYEEKKSIQVGDPQFLSNISRLRVVSLFRQNDMENGGHGAPLSPIYHVAIAKKMNLTLPFTFVNIGGVANLTFYDGKNIIGFDTGPGNGLMDLYCQTVIDKEYDKNGQIASRGSINKKALIAFDKDDYFKKIYPKSLDKLHFKNYLNNLLLKNLPSTDTLATLSEFTASSISKSINLLPKRPNSVILLGGGQFNKDLVKRLKIRTSIKIFSSEQLGLPSKYIEAELFAYLAARSLNELPITYPLTTGVKNSLSGGQLFKPA